MVFNILHLEKSVFFVKSFEELLVNLGHKVFNASDVDEAFEILNNNEIDLIVTAITGNESLFDRLHNSRFDDLPILVLTSTDNIETRQKLFNYGVSDCIVKNQISIEKLRAYFLSFNKSHGYDLKDRVLDIAVLDDSMLSLKVIKKIFSKSPFTSIDYFSSSEEFLKSEKVYTIYLIDLVMPKITGEEVMLELRGRHPNSIIILMSSVTNYKTISNVLLLGADDFLMKPFDRNFFIARISSHLRVHFLMQDLEEKNKLLELLAHTDGLTGLYNHRFIMERLKEEVNRASRYGHPVSIAMIDIDHFKKVNDLYGHPVGDEVLVGVSDVMRKVLRSTDIIGRYGGEEFLIVFPNCNSEQAYTASMHLKNNIENFNFASIEHKITISGGICEYIGQSISSMISVADENLYTAKNSGRNNIYK